MQMETPRLLLRRWLARDAAPYAALNADPEVMAFFPATITAEQSGLAIDIFEANFERLGYSFWAVEEINSGTFVGSVGLENYDLQGVNGGEPRTEVAIGWQLARAFWGQGLASEAAQAVCAFAKNQLKLNEIIAIMAEKNERSIAVCERLGMVRDTAHSPLDPHFPPGHPLKPQALYRLSFKAEK
jgi:RimJ/RimL family protein N-acetyltransferase